MDNELLSEQDLAVNKVWNKKKHDRSSFKKLGSAQNKDFKGRVNQFCPGWLILKLKFFILHLAYKKNMFNSLTPQLFCEMSQFSTVLWLTFLGFYLIPEPILLIFIDLPISLKFFHKLLNNKYA